MSKPSKQYPKAFNYLPTEVKLEVIITSMHTLGLSWDTVMQAIYNHRQSTGQPTDTLDENIQALAHDRGFLLKTTPSHVDERPKQQSAGKKAKIAPVTPEKDKKQKSKKSTSTPP